MCRYLWGGVLSVFIVDDVRRSISNLHGQKLCREGGLLGSLRGAWVTIATCLPNRAPSVSKTLTVVDILLLDGIATYFN